MKKLLAIVLISVFPSLSGCSFVEWLINDEDRVIPAATYLQPDGTFVLTPAVKARLESDFGGTEVLGATYDKENGVLLLKVESPAEEAAETAIEEFLENPVSWVGGIAVLAGIARVLTKRKKSKQPPRPAPPPAPGAEGPIVAGVPEPPK